MRRETNVFLSWQAPKDSDEFERQWRNVREAQVDFESRVRVIIRVRFRVRFIVRDFRSF